MSAAVLKGRPTEELPQVSIWEYVESKVKHFGSKIAQVSLIMCYALYRVIQKSRNPWAV
jgi:hypothetical protein